MMRPRQTVLAFVLCLAVGAAAMGWLGLTVVRLDAEREAHLREAAQEERVRLALWRMDSALSALIARESMRPDYMYAAFYPAEQAYTRLYAQLDPGEILVASPLLTFSSPHIKLHFTISPSRELTSPQAPQSNMRDLAETGYVEHEAINAAEGLLEDLRTGIGVEAFRDFEPPAPALETRSAAPAERGASQQVASNALEFEARQNNIYLQQAEGPQKVMYKSNLAPTTADTAEQDAPPRDWSEGDLAPTWIGNELFLLRRVMQSTGMLVQGCWLDWGALRPWLLASIADLFPDARLEALKDGLPEAELTGRRLAALPVALRPGAGTTRDIEVPSTTRTLLWAALGCIALATLALVALMAGSIALSERRAAFVSAVTHELRTPLTTFQMYTEMLREGMVRDEVQRQRYLGTLHAESNRLAHLVENVLSYARLERNRIDRRLEGVSAAELLEGCVRRLEQRCEQAGMQLVVTAPEAAPTVRVDRDAVERILFNLVDNACKYAGRADDKRVHLTLAEEKRAAVFRVYDHGPGVAQQERRRIFRAFTKATRDAAHATPGVGLGLGLSRRLARAMGGDLKAEARAEGGACFVLRLPM